MKYVLKARNESGATVEFKGNTIFQTLATFKSMYSMKGFLITVYDNNGVVVFTN